MKWMKTIVAALCLLSVMAVAAGCENEGPAEKAGKKIDRAVEDAGDAIEDAGDKIEDSVDN